MKERKIGKRFPLNKQTIAHLTDSEKARVLAGADRCTLTVCKSKSAYYHSSTAYIINTEVIPETEMDTRLLPCYADTGQTDATIID